MSIATLGPSGAQRSIVTSSLARDRLGVWSVLWFVVAASAPLAIMGESNTSEWNVTGLPGLPAAYLCGAVLLGLFSVGYVAMARHITNAGAFYSYIARGMGRVPGVGSAMVAVLAYSAMQVSLYGSVGAVGSETIRQLTGVAIPWWGLALTSWVLVTTMGVLRIDLNGKVLAVLLTVECLIVLGYDVVMLGHPRHGHLDLSTVSPRNVIAPGFAALILLAVQGFIGFEDSANYGEETTRARKTVGRATYLALLTTTVLYTLTSWAMTNAAGADRIVAQSRQHGPDLLFELVSGGGAAPLADVGRILIITSEFASLLSFHNTIARYLFALGRERVLPSWLGRTSLRFRSPVGGSLTQSTIAFVVILAVLVLQANPLIDLGYMFSSFAALGIMILMVGTSAAVIGYFARNPRQRADENLWRTTIAPGLAVLGMGGVLIASLRSFAIVLGVDPGSPMVWIIPSIFGAAAVIGMVWALVLRKVHPETYHTIGLGADALSQRSTVDLEPVTAAPEPRRPQPRHR